MIDNGVLSFKKSPDYEKPMGGTDTAPWHQHLRGGWSRATDETRRVASKTVMVKVTDVDEAMVRSPCRRGGPRRKPRFTADGQRP